ncbi:hypothetical protein ANN_04027 [Periplaneta americana]|uniref:DUF4817 domain-containing protein n=1 Tax=Periplaneta americana TaxID=6978 RepID=A0ABQ8T906_PERAM|nr:hypothetical protein ANN_04027 [Periplaneta americana]
MYGKADGNAALARRLYQERYPQRQCPDRKTFVRLHYRRGGPIAWPPPSPDLNPLDFYLWGHLKSLVYSSPVPDLESLRNQIVACSEDIRNTPGVWDRVRRSMRHRCEARVNLIKDENGDLLADSHSILNRWKNYCGSHVRFDLTTSRRKCKVGRDEQVARASASCGMCCGVEEREGPRQRGEISRLFENAILTSVVIF